MSDMIKKMADAIEIAGVYGGYNEMAENALIALRNPSDDMIEVFSALPRQHNRLDMWCAMIDVALGRLELVKGDGNVESERHYDYDD